MKICVLYLSICVFHTLASNDTKTEVFIRSTPSRSQFLQYEHVSLTCEVSAGGSRLRRNTTTRGSESCPYGWGKLNGSTCTIAAVYPTDTGLYWCESTSGQQSQTVHIRVTAGPVILESPALPVTERETVTLRCRNRKPSSKLSADFYKNDILIGSSFSENLTIHSVSKSDEGLYKCRISEVGESAESRLEVKGVFQTQHNSSETEKEVSEESGPDDAVTSYFTIVLHVVVGTPYLLSTILLGLIYRDSRRAHQLEDRRNHVVMEVE